MSGVPIGSGSNSFPCFYQDGNFRQFKPKFGSDNSVPRITVKEFTTHTITVPITANNNIRPFHMNSVLATVLHELMPNAVGQQSDNFYLSCRVSSFPTLSRLKNNDIITAKDTSIEKLLDGPEMKNCSYSRTIQFIDSVNYREVDLLAERVSQYSCISVEDIQLAPVSRESYKGSKEEFFVLHWFLTYVSVIMPWYY